jgi:hypothetical protein
MRRDVKEFANYSSSNKMILTGTFLNPPFYSQQERDFSLRHKAQTDSGAQPASYAKSSGHETDHSPPTNSEVTNSCGA